MVKLLRVPPASMVSGTGPGGRAGSANTMTRCPSTKSGDGKPGAGVAVGFVMAGEAGGARPRGVEGAGGGGGGGAGEGGGVGGMGGAGATGRVALPRSVSPRSRAGGPSTEGGDGKPGAGVAVGFVMAGEAGGAVPAGVEGGGDGGGGVAGKVGGLGGMGVAGATGRLPIT